VMDSWEKPDLPQKLADLLGIDLAVPAYKGRSNKGLPGASLPLLLAVNRAGVCKNRESRKGFLMPQLAKMTVADPTMIDDLFSSVEAAKVRQFYDPHAVVDFTDQTRTAFLAPYQDTNARFLAHPSVQENAAVWA
jgi:hypothetical protein